MRGTPTCFSQFITVHAVQVMHPKLTPFQIFSFGPFCLACTALFIRNARTTHTLKTCFVYSPKGGRGCLMSSSCLESQGFHFNSPFLFPLLFFYLTPLLFCLALFVLMVHSPDCFPPAQYVSLRDRRFCLALAAQLGDNMS